MLNQENKADNGKHDPTLLMHDLGKALKAVIAVLNYGAEKYEPRGWKTVEPRRYQSALLRHYNDHYIMGELTDNESGLLHLAHKATNALFLLQLHIENAEKSSKTPPDFYTYKKPPRTRSRQSILRKTRLILRLIGSLRNFVQSTSNRHSRFQKACLIFRLVFTLGQSTTTKQNHIIGSVATRLC